MKIQASDFAELKVPKSLSLSPDGKQLAFVLSECDFEKRKYFANLHVLDMGSKKSRQWTFGDVKDRSPVWSSDGKQLAFLRFSEGQDGICILRAGGGEPEQVCAAKGFFSNIRWAENDNSIIAKFLKADEETEPGAKQPAVRKITGLFYQADGLGYLPLAKLQLYKLNLRTKKFTALTKEKDNVGVWAVASDGAEVAYVANVHRDPDTHSMQTQIFLLNLKTNRRRRLPTPFGEKQALSFSPNGKYLVYLGHNNPLDAWSIEPTHPHLIDLKTGKVRDLTPDNDRMSGDLTIGDTGFEFGETQIFWSADSKHLYYQVTDQGDTLLVRASLKAGNPEAVWKRRGVVSGFSLAGRRIILSYAGLNALGDLYLCENIAAKSPRFSKVTSLNRDFVRSRKFGETIEVRFKSGDGTPLHGWMIQPPDFSSRKKYPAILEIHGGPRVQYGRIFFHEMQYLAAQGFVVFYTNPRGSQGYGKEFAGSTVAAWGTVDYEDIMAAADYLEAQSFIDPKRIGITGGSYGGFMTTYAVGHTNRFRAAVATRGAANWATVQSTCDVGWHVRNEFGGYFWENPEYYQRISPITNADKIRTPLLLIYKDADLRCPSEQALQLYVTLKLMGKAPVELWRFPDEGHNMSRSGRPDRRVIRIEGIAGWFRKWMK
jgi:dipeptidyl aminopeptidase/acylaminoacyl peptidase